MVISVTSNEANIMNNLSIIKNEMEDNNLFAREQLFINKNRTFNPFIQVLSARTAIPLLTWANYFVPCTMQGKSTAVEIYYSDHSVKILRQPDM